MNEAAKALEAAATRAGQVEAIGWLQDFSEQSRDKSIQYRMALLHATENLIAKHNKAREQGE